jgi:hypothetical protein
MTIFDANKKGHSVRCGKCVNCLNARVSGWNFRLQQEEKISDSAHFATLTYNTDKVPITPNGFMTLKKADCQQFLKRLRKGHKGLPIKYYYCGEYGSKNHRPHYHFIIFNTSPDAIIKAWQLGDSFFGTVTGASIGYTLKYMCKEKTIPKHQRDDREKEYSNMSKRLGAAYLTPSIISYHRQDFLNRVAVHDGQMLMPMPRYYKAKIFTPEQIGYMKGHFEKLALEAEPLSQAELDAIHYSVVQSFKKLSKQAGNRL